MAKIINPHNKFLKEMLTQPEAARIFLRDFLPPAVARQIGLQPAAIGEGLLHR